MAMLLSFRVASRALLLLLGLAAAFQLVVLAGFVPVEMVWGGRLKNVEERTVGVLVSLSILAVMMHPRQGPSRQSLLVLCAGTAKSEYH